MIKSKYNLGRYLWMLPSRRLAKLPQTVALRLNWYFNFETQKGIFTFDTQVDVPTNTHMHTTSSLSLPTLYLHTRMYILSVSISYTFYLPISFILSSLHEPTVNLRTHIPIIPMTTQVHIFSPFNSHNHLYQLCSHLFVCVYFTVPKHTLSAVSNHQHRCNI